MSYAYVHDEETGLGASLFDKSGPSIEFAEQEVRLGFIRKVFGRWSYRDAHACDAPTVLVLKQHLLCRHCTVQYACQSPSCLKRVNHVLEIITDESLRVPICAECRPADSAAGHHSSSNSSIFVIPRHQVIRVHKSSKQSILITFPGSVVMSTCMIGLMAVRSGVALQDTAQASLMLCALGCNGQLCKQCCVCLISFSAVQLLFSSCKSSISLQRICASIGLSSSWAALWPVSEAKATVFFFPLLAVNTAAVP